ncbi:MAG: FAD-dependent oxidoreductase [Desulfobacterales bacterium]|nr:FAD-dependent oxidoreductase [Desulfobacterales bacterium]
MAENGYDVMILGTGPAGLTAGLYGQRLGLNTVVLGDTPGGNMYMIESLMNFPGFPGGIPGTQLGVTVFQQAQQDGALFTMALLDTLRAVDGGFEGVDVNGQTWRAPRAIVATGRTPKTLKASNAGLKGVHVCSICDGPLYRDQNAALAVVGGATPAAQHALSLSRIAEKVLLIADADRFEMDAAHEKLISERPNIETRLNTRVTGYKGLDSIEAITVAAAGGEEAEIPVDGVFLAVGWTPNTEMLDIEVDKTPEGYLKTDEALMTSHPGLFAAGDVRETDMRQVLTACADGARAALYASMYS